MDINEKAPPGWRGTVAAMRLKHKEIKNPYALAWHMAKKKYRPHYKDVKSSKAKRVPPKTFKEFFYGP